MGTTCPRRPDCNRQPPRGSDRVERFFNRLKHYRRVAPGYDTLDATCEGFLCLASLLMSLASM
ncbi:MAG: transposase [Planctomycetaceae bacterium]|nr:transposase [Planctomycetaceae bacterium]